MKMFVNKKVIEFYYKKQLQ